MYALHMASFLKLIFVQSYFKMFVFDFRMITKCLNLAHSGVYSMKVK